MRIPKHVGIIPDGNRRWAQNKGMTKDKGYELLQQLLTRNYCFMQEA